MNLEKVLETILSQGVVGVFCVILLYALKRKDEALKAESDSRIADAKAVNDRTITLLERVLTAIETLDDARERDRERKP